MCAEWSRRFGRGRGRPPSGIIDSGSYPSLLGSSSSLDRPIWKRPDDRRRERLNSDLLTAVCRSDISRVKRLLEVENGPKPTAFCSESKASTLHIAVIRGDIEILEVLLMAGADLESRDIQGRLPLHIAAWEGSTNCTNAILQRNQDLINSKVTLGAFQWNQEGACGWEHDHQEVTSLMSLMKTEEGLTALHIASMHCQLGIVDLLLKNGANIQEKDQLGRSVLDVAGLASTPQKPEEFTRQSVPKTPNNSLSGVGMTTPTAYSSAMTSGFVMPATFFKDPGVPPSPQQMTDTWGSQSANPTGEFAFPQLDKPTPYMAAPMEPIGMDAVGMNINKALHDIVSTLMSSGARIADEQTDGSEEATSSVLLHSAIATDEVFVVEMLLDNGASLIAFDPNGDSPLHFAVRRKKLGSLQAIVERLKEGQIDAKNRDGFTALHLAVAIEWPEGIGFLLESRASIRIKTDGGGETVYHIAAKLGNPKLMEELLLVEGAAQVADEKDSEGLTPLLRAVQRPSKNIVVQLIKMAKADVGVHLKDGSNILHYAAAESDVEVLRYLSKLESCRMFMNELSPPESDGMAPLHIAAENGNVEFTEILLQAGADPNLHTTNDPKGKMTALHLAAKNGFRHTIETILKYDTCSLNAEDKHGWKPLHMASVYGHGICAIVMIKKGADLSDEIDFHGTTKSALDLMSVNVPRAGELLESLLDAYIELPPRKGTKGMKFLNNPSCAIGLNFEVLLSANDPTGRQLNFLNSVVNTNNDEVKEILLHPLIEIFLYIKWGKLWKFFAILLFFYFLHTLTLTAYCVVIFIAHYNNIVGKTFLQSTFLASLVPIIIAEALQLLRLERQYWKDHESWVKVLMIVTSGTVGYGSVFVDDTEWIRHFSSLAILSSWIELLFLCSRFRYWGLDVLMFEKVIQNVLTVLSKFVFLFLGFMFALMIHFEGAAPFANFWDSFCQSVIMVVELNYGGMFPESSANVNAVIGRFIYVCYTVFVALAMLNLTVGLAVSDIAVLEKQGRVEKLVKRTSFLSFLETLVYDERIARCFPTPQGHEFDRHSFRSIDAVYTVFPNRVGILPHYLRAALLLKALDPEKTEPLTPEHFDEKINEVNKKVDKMSREILRLLNYENPKADINGNKQ